MELTAEQRAIVEADATDLAVTAGAGSGKTHVLVERYLRLLTTCAIPEIAAVTFTEAAATELRERVRLAVMSDPALDHHREDLDEAAIGTIHALALRLLREHPVEAAIDPVAAVLAEDEAELLRRAACVEAVDAAAESGDARTLALRAIGVYHVELQLPLMLASRDDVEAAFGQMGRDPTSWPDNLRALLDREYALEQAGIRSEVAALASGIESDLSGASDRLAEIAREVLDGLSRASGAADWVAFTEALSEARWRTDLRPGSRTTSPDVDIKDAFRALRALDADAQKLPSWNQHDAPALVALEGLLDLFEDAARRYAAAKRERHALDFLDLELGAVALLRDHPPVATEVRARFQHLMVDEAQDINPTQAELIHLLAGDGVGARPQLFLVGDEKQSIYRFRGADVQRFAGLRQLVLAHGGPTLPLSRSFRTHEALVGRVNELFTEVFGAATEPFEAAMELMQGRVVPAPDGGPHLALLPVGDRTSSGDRASDHDRRRVEADLVASEIASLIASGRLVWDRRAEDMRAARPGDIAVLLRRFSNVHTFEQALEAYGMPYATPSGTGFFTRQEILDCGHLLRWLAEPHDEIALTGALRSPFFALADDTLLALRETRRPLPAALLEPPAGVRTEERARCEHASRVLGELRDAAGAAPADALLDLALERTAVEASWSPIEGGEQARANIRKLVRIVRSLAGYSLSEVVEYLEQRRDELDAREAPAVLDRPDAVQLMTVHGSKGLEFPIVFVPEAHLASRDTYAAIRWRRGDGVSATLQRSDEDTSRPRPGLYAHLQLRDEREEEAEHRRLFYVAATRAADYLFVSGDDGNAGWIGAALGACASGSVRDVDVRAPVPPDVGAIASRSAPRELRVHPESGEQDYVAPLLARPRVIPLRASTPVTALRSTESARPPSGRGDGLGALRGRLVHRALEVSGGDVGSVDGRTLSALAREESDRALDNATVATLADEAAGMLERFAESSVAAALAERGVERWFELPFAWDWDGVPVHGSIDLVYRDTSGWHVVDFKTDRLEGTSATDVAAGYLVQIGLYGRAIAAAVGAETTGSLLFLRTGELITPDRAALDAALDEVHAAVDAGSRLAPTDEGELDRELY